MKTDDSTGLDSDQEPWIARLSEAFERYADACDWSAAWPAENSFAALLAPLTPLIQRGRAELLAELETLPRSKGSPDPVRLAPLLTAHLLNHLSQLTVRTVVVELHAARQRGELVAATPEARFAEFVAGLRTPARAFEFLAGYPALARQVVIATDQWRAASVEFAARYAKDAAMLSDRFFGGSELPELVEIDGGAGDRHGGGRSVFVLTWADGRRLVYKPRSLAVETHFQDLLRWLNSRGSQPELRTLEIVDRGDYGWVEFVEHGECADRAAVERFYLRQGSLLALVYMLSATDLHADNLLAAGEHPVLIDLEALFHQPLPGSRKSAAAQGLTESVLALRMLPQATYVEGFADPIDFSGMGATGGQATPFRASVWRNVGRDDMCLESLPVATEAGANRPRLAGAEVDYRQFKAQLVAGFVDTYRLLAAHRRELLLLDSPIAAFANDQVRFIARPTQVYAILLDQSFHPQALVDPALRLSIYRRLSRQTSDFACLTRIVPHEIADLARNDIPLFTTTPGSRDLLTATGEQIADFFPEAAMSLVRTRIDGLGEADLARQLWLIDAAFAIAGQRPEPRSHTSTTLSDAVVLGDRLLTHAIVRGDEIGWIGLHPRGRGWSIGAIGSDLLHGQAGIALFLAHLGELTDGERFRQSARRICRTICSRLAWDDEHRLALANLPEAGHVPHVLAHLARLWRFDHLGGEAAQLAAEFEVELPPSDGSLASADRLVGRALEAAEGPWRGLPGVENPTLAGLAGEGWQALGRLVARSAIARQSAAA